MVRVRKCLWIAWAGGRLDWNYTSGGRGLFPPIPIYYCLWGAAREKAINYRVLSCLYVPGSSRMRSPRDLQFPRIMRNVQQLFNYLNQLHAVEWTTEFCTVTPWRIPLLVIHFSGILSQIDRRRQVVQHDIEKWNWFLMGEDKDWVDLLIHNDALSDTLGCFVVFANRLIRRMNGMENKKLQ